MPRRPVSPARALRLAGPLALSTSALVLALPAFAQGTPRSIGECERLKSDLAYNQCLAMFGPEAKMITSGSGAGDGGGGPILAMPPGSAAVMGKADDAVADEAPRGRGRGRYGYRGAGRKSASFDVAGAGDEPIAAGDSGAEGDAKPKRRRWYRRH